MYKTSAAGLLNGEREITAQRMERSFLRSYSCMIVDQYTEQNASQGGKALLQWCERSDDEGDDSDTERCIPRKKRKMEPSSTPLILAICTPLMARAHMLVQQASEVVFCDSTLSLDRFNTSVFIVWCSTYCSPYR